MANAITPSLRASLERLKHAGTVNGVCLSWRRQVLVNLMPFEEFRVEQVIQILNDAKDHFQGGGTRSIDSFWMAYHDVHLLSVFSGDVAVMFLHVRPEEGDFLTGVARTFLQDAQLMVSAALNPASSSGPETESNQEATPQEEENWLPEPPRMDPNQTNVM